MGTAFSLLLPLFSLLLCFTTISILHSAFLTHYIEMCSLDSLSLPSCLPTGQRRKLGSVAAVSHYASLQLFTDICFAVMISGLPGCSLS